MMKISIFLLFLSFTFTFSSKTALLEWAKSHGATSNVTIGSNGVVALKDISEGEVLLSVPEKLIISSFSPEMVPSVEAAFDRLSRTRTSLDLIAVRILLIAYSSQYNEKSCSAVDKMTTWSQERVRQFLVDNNLDIMVDVFQSLSINGSMLSLLDMEDLNEADAGLRIHRKQLIRVRNSYLEKEADSDNCAAVKKVLMTEKSESYHPIEEWSAWLSHFPTFDIDLIKPQVLMELQGYTKDIVASVEETRLKDATLAWSEISSVLLIPNGISEEETRNGHMFGMNFDSFRKVLNVVRSRSRYSGGDKKGDLILVPVIDFAKYDPSQCNMLIEKSSLANEMRPMYDASKSSFIWKADRKWKKGEEVGLCYGAYDNLTLLLDYGFTTLPNPFDYIRFSLPRRKSTTFQKAKRTNSKLNKLGEMPLPQFSIDPRLAMKLKNLPLHLVKAGEHGKAAQIMKTDKGVFQVNSDGFIPEDVLCGLRYHSLTLADEDFILKKNLPLFDFVKEKLQKGLPITVDSEMRMKKKLLEGARNTMRTFSTVIEEDEKLLKTATENSSTSYDANEKNEENSLSFRYALRLRIQLKRILSNFMKNYAVE